MRASNYTVVLAAVVVVVAQFQGACAERRASQDEGASSSSEPKQVVLHGHTLFPDDGIQDWVSYADQIAVVTVTAEREMASEPDAFELNRMIGRIVTLRIDESLWEAPGRQSLGEADTIEIVGFGWVVHNKAKTLVVADGAPRLEVGGQYIVPLVQWEGRGWGPLTPHAIVGEFGSIPAERDANERDARNPVGERLRGLSPDERRRLLRDTRVRDEVLPLMNLPPEERRLAVTQNEAVTPVAAMRQIPVPDSGEGAEPADD